MCYFNGVKVTREQHIRLKNLEKLVARYDFLSNPMHAGFEYGPAPVLKRIDGQEDFDIVEMEWGFLPPYIRNATEAERFRKGYKKPDGSWQTPILTLNATSEEMLLPRKMYREAVLKRRILVLSTGFYEWRHVFPLNKRTGLPLKTAEKYPYLIKVKDREYYYMAGFWQGWTDKDSGEYVETFSLITIEANKLMQQIHNTKKRMPTILTEDLAWEWLFGDLTEERISEIGQYQFPAEQMEAYTIDKDFRSASDPTAAFKYAELSELELA
jgi:putative SOS response-associated peptidase YedK